MFGLSWVAPLEPLWREVLFDIARGRGFLNQWDPATLGGAVRELSEAYNREGTAPKDAWAARLLFSFVRDAPKGAAAVRELLELGELTPPNGRPLRILDLGAGLGATSVGVLRALAKRWGTAWSVEAEWIDSSHEALALGSELFKRTESTLVPKGTLRTHAHSAHRAPLRGTYDLILLGQVLSELDHEDKGRVHLHAELLTRLVSSHLEPRGALVVVEPALRDRTRHLHAVRDALSERAVSLFAPCLHREACPMLLTLKDWCHEDLPIDLPEWLHPVARAAGLRYEGLTFSYLVIRHAGLPTLREHAPLRVVSDLIRTKGKREAWVCGDPLSDGGERKTRRVRLDRDASSSNRAWEEVGRGDLISLTPPTLRIEKGTSVERG